MRDITIFNGNCLDILDDLPDNSVDAIVTDPPYELNFMGKGWDNAGVSFNKETWAKCLRVLKHGGYLLAFGGSRTYHRIACAIEDGGFEIRDCIMWLYGSGFPKSMNIGLAIDKKNGVESEVVGEGKSGVSSRAYQSEETTTAGQYKIKKAQNGWQGWGTALKPSFEPIILARKPFKGSLLDNIQEYGVGGLNIDECRVSLNKGETIAKNIDFTDQKQAEGWGTKRCITEPSMQGRFPANTILDSQDGEEWRRYFYCAKASKKDRNEGLDNFQKKTTDDGRNKPIDNPFLRGETKRYNTHPTVKPTSLMQYLIRLVSPMGATILDPFMGSGSTGKAVVYENKERRANYKFIGIELSDEYCKIAEARIKHAIDEKETNE